MMFLVQRKFARPTKPLMQSKWIVYVFFALVSCAFLFSAPRTGLSMSATPKSSMTDLERLRGINIYPWFGKPAIAGEWKRDSNDSWRYAWPPFRTFDGNSFKAELRALRDTGMNFLRVPILAGPFMEFNKPQRIAALRNVSTVLKTALDMGFTLLVEYHSTAPGSGEYKRITASAKSRAHFIEAFKDLYSVVAPLSKDKIIFETINEPTGPCDDESALEFQTEIIRAVIKDHPDLKITVTGACYSSYRSLIKIDPARFGVPKENLYFTFHYYSPFSFTHQGNTWSYPPALQYVTGLPWPARGCDLDKINSEIEETYRDTEAYGRYGDKILDETHKIVSKYCESGAAEHFIGEEFEKVREWADDHDVPRSNIILGEFGVLKREGKWNGARLDSAARWTKAVREEAEKSGFAWTIWNYKDGYSLVRSDEPGDFYPELIDALGLKQVKK